MALPGEPAAVFLDGQEYQGQEVEIAEDVAGVGG